MGSPTFEGDSGKEEPFLWGSYWTQNVELWVIGLAGWSFKGAHLLTRNGNRDSHPNVNSSWCHQNQDTDQVCPAGGQVSTGVPPPAGQDPAVKRKEHN